MVQPLKPGAIVDPTPAYYRDRPAVDYRPHRRFTAAAIKSALKDARMFPLSGTELACFSPLQHSWYLGAILRQLELRKARLVGERGGT